MPTCCTRPAERERDPTDYERLDHEVTSVPAGADGVLALPVLGDGERTDPELRGAFHRKHQALRRAVLARAMMEGVAFAIRDQLDRIRAGGARVTGSRSSGGDTQLA